MISVLLESLTQADVIMSGADPATINSDENNGGDRNQDIPFFPY